MGVSSRVVYANFTAIWALKQYYIHSATGELAAGRVKVRGTYICILLYAYNIML